MDIFIGQFHEPTTFLVQILKTFWVVINQVPQLNLGQVNINLEVGHVGPQHYFYFSDAYGRTFHIHLYTGGDFVTGDIRLKTGYKEYELISLLKENNPNMNNLNINNLVSNIKYFKNYFEELLDSQE